jgi:hypothetical protein
VISEAEQHFNEGLAGLSKSDPVGHDRQLELALFDWASKIYCAFLDEASHALRQGSWTLDDFSTYAGLFISDVGQGAFLQFRALAASTENRVEWKAQVFAHSELVHAVLNSVRSRQKGIELTTSARAYLFGQSEPVNKSREIAEILTETASTEAGRLRTGTNRAETSPGQNTDKTTQGMVSKSTNGTAGGRLERRKPSQTLTMRRAKGVSKLLRELQIVRPRMYNQSHYDKVEREHRNYLLFKIAQLDSDVRQWIENVQDRRGLIGLAQEIAARHYGVSLATIKTDWSHRKARRRSTQKSR